LCLFDEVDALSRQTQHIFEQIFIARNELGVSLPFGHSLLGLTDSLSPRRVIPGQRSALSTGLGGSTQVSELLAGLLKCQDAPVRSSSDLLVDMAITIHRWVSGSGVGPLHPAGAYPMRRSRHAMPRRWPESTSTGGPRASVRRHRPAR
jgi:hypothetical protein